MFTKMAQLIGRTIQAGPDETKALDMATCIEITSGEDITLTYELPDGVEFNIQGSLDGQWFQGPVRFGSLVAALDCIGFSSQWAVENGEYVQLLKAGQILSRTSGKVWEYKAGEVYLDPDDDSQSLTDYVFGSGVATQTIKQDQNGMFWFEGLYVQGDLHTAAQAMFKATEVE